MQVFIASFVKGFRFYLPIHLIPYLMRHYRDVWTPQGFHMLRKRVGGDALKSSLFLSLYTSVWIALVCLFRNIEQRDRPVHTWLAGFICGSSVLIEPPGRRSELNIYTLARWMSMGYRAMVERGFVAYHKNGEVPLFAFAMAVIMCAHILVRVLNMDLIELLQVLLSARLEQSSQFAVVPYEAFVRHQLTDYAAYVFPFRLRSKANP